MRYLLSLVFLIYSTSLAALSSDALTVIRIIDGDSIVVNCRCAGVDLPIAVRLQFIDAPEMRIDNLDNPLGNNAKLHLESLLKAGDQITLWTADKAFQSDNHGRTLALVFPRKNKVSIQAAMIKAGHSVYWQRYGQLPDQQHQQFSTLEQTAKQQGIGLWTSDAAWMLSKQGERQWGK